VTETFELAPTQPRTSLVDLLDRVLATGVVLSGDLTLCLAGVDLVTIRLRALITSVRDDDG
jgi:gas vesicle protein GvpA/GvpJ/GvpM family